MWVSLPWHPGAGYLWVPALCGLPQGFWYPRLSHIFIGFLVKFLRDVDFPLAGRGGD